MNMAWEFRSSTELLLVARRGKADGEKVKKICEALGNPRHLY